MVRIPELTERMVEAVYKAIESPHADAYERMRIGKSMHDEILYHDLAWVAEHIRPADVVQRSVTQPIAKAPSGPISSRAAVPVRSASSDANKENDPKKPFWRFW